MTFGAAQSDWWACRVDDRWIEMCGPYRKEGTVTAMTARQQLDWAKSLDARLPTPFEFDAAWLAAEVRVSPVPRDPGKSSVTALDADVDVALCAFGEKTAKVVAGKTWTESERATRARAVNYGFRVPNDGVITSGAFPTWRGIKAHRSVDGLGWVLQPPGAVHGWNHVDYSQCGYAVRDLDPGYESVGEETMIAAPPAPTPLPAIVMKRARNFSPGRPAGPPNIVVVHTAECGEITVAAENLQTWAAGPGAPRASWHYAIDADSITQSVSEDDRSWSVGKNPAQDRGIHIELAGRASQTVEQWADAFSRDTLELAARLTADICHRRSIDPQWLGATELRSGMSGICGHNDVRIAWPGTTTHVDPGQNFPKDKFVARVNELLDQA